MFLFTETCDPADPRKEKVIYRLSKKEKEYLKKEAKKRGIHLTTLLRQCIVKALKPDNTTAENT